MVNKSISFVKEFARLYTGKHITRSSAALSYYLTMTIFPLIICLYTMLGNSYSKAMTVLSFAEKFMAAETARSIRDFLLYVASNNSNAMMVAGLTVLVTSASAACRSLQATIGDMQGGQRFQGLLGFLFSIVFSLLFLAALYFAVLVMLTGHTVIDKINELLPFIDISNSWNWLRFIVLFGIFFVIIWGVYEISKRSSDNYHTFGGAILSTVASVVVCVVFSIFISASAKYPLVYGSLASVILLMFWLYTCCLMIYCGAVFNITIRNIKSCEAE